MANSGTIQVQVGSFVIIGESTLFTKEAKKGAFVYVYGLNQVFQISSIVNDTRLTITKSPVGQAGQGLSGLIYALCDHFTPAIGLPMPTPDQLNVQMRIMNRASIALDREIPNPIP